MPSTSVMPTTLWCCGMERRPKPYALKEELGGLLDTMGLTLSKEKTKVTHITKGFHFLGYWIIRA